MVVEDNAALRKGLSIRLRVNGYEVLFAEDAIRPRHSDDGKARPDDS